MTNTQLLDSFRKHGGLGWSMDTCKTCGKRFGQEWAAGFGMKRKEDCDDCVNDYERDIENN